MCRWGVTTSVPPHFLQMCRWGVFWDAPDAVAQCLDRFSHFDTNTLRAADINDVLGTPRAIHGMRQFGRVQRKCSEWLERFYSHVPKIITDRELNSRFCTELDGAAITLWARMEYLDMRSENEVAIALAFWYNAQSRSEDVARTLSGLIRVRHMTKSFR